MERSWSSGQVRERARLPREQYNTIMSGSAVDRYGSIAAPPDGAEEETSAYVLHPEEEEKDGLMRDGAAEIDDDGARSTASGGSSDDGARSESSGEDHGLSLQELLYSSSSYHAIARPVALAMVLSALAATLVNTDETRAQGEAAMAGAYQMWTVDGSSGAGGALAVSLANALVIGVGDLRHDVRRGAAVPVQVHAVPDRVSYMIVCSATLLGILGGNLLQTAIYIYGVPVDKISFYFFMFNFALTGVLAVFWGQGIPKSVTQGYLIATSVILAWHLAYFNDWTTWTLLFMLAIYDLCAVLSPCGPLKALVNLMSADDAPEMPGLLYEADLPPEAKRPRHPTAAAGGGAARNHGADTTGGDGTHATTQDPTATVTTAPTQTDPLAVAAPREVQIPLAIAKVYQLTVISVPRESLKVLYPNRFDDSNVSASPLLTEDGASEVNLTDNPTPQQLRAIVTVRLPLHGGHIEPLNRRGKKVYLERDRHGVPKRVCGSIARARSLRK